MNAEKMFDMLPYVVDMYEKLDFEGIQNKYKGSEDVEKAGMAILKDILKASKKVKTEFFEIVAVYREVSVAEVKKLPATEVIKSIKEIFAEVTTMDFFKQAMQ